MISIKNNAVNNIYHFKPTPEETVDEVCIGILFIVFCVLAYPCFCLLPFSSSLYYFT